MAIHGKTLVLAALPVRSDWRIANPPQVGNLPHKGRYAPAPNGTRFQ